MIRQFCIVIAFAILSGTAAKAESWSLDSGASALAFGSVKSEFIGEVHRFHGLSGNVAEDGAVTVEIDLGTVDTTIDIRNERMIEHVFKLAPKATIEGKLDTRALAELSQGESTVMPIEATLSFLGKDVRVTPEMFVVRIGDDKVLALTESLVFVSTDELGIDAGIDALREIAGLDRITRAVPISMRLMFTREAPET